jgi:hypothetical protein
MRINDHIKRVYDTPEKMKEFEEGYEKFLLEEKNCAEFMYVVKLIEDDNDICPTTMDIKFVTKEEKDDWILKNDDFVNAHSRVFVLNCVTREFVTIVDNYSKKS